MIQTCLLRSLFLRAMLFLRQAAGSQLQRPNVLALKWDSHVHLILFGRIYWTHLCFFFFFSDLPVAHPEGMTAQDNAVMCL